MFCAYAIAYIHITNKKISSQLLNYYCTAR